MNSIIDVIGALIASTVIIITILLTIINIQKIKYNSETLLGLYSAGDLIASAIDQEYLEKVGYNLYNDEVRITVATPTNFHFNYKSTRTATSMNNVRIFTSVVNGNTSLQAIDPIVPPGGFDSTPVFLESGNIFTYYDGGNPPAPTTVLDDIHSVKVELVFIAPAWNDNPTKPNLRYPITFWRYFKNVYIDNPRP